MSAEICYIIVEREKDERFVKVFNSDTFFFIFKSSSVHYLCLLFVPIERNNDFISKRISVLILPKFRE